MLLVRRGEGLPGAGEAFSGAGDGLPGAATGAASVVATRDAIGSNCFSLLVVLAHRSGSGRSKPEKREQLSAKLVGTIAQRSQTPMKRAHYFFG